MYDTLTGERKKYKRKEYRKHSRVWVSEKETSELIQSNFEGNSNEIIANLSFAEAFTDTKKLQKAAKNYRERLQRNLPYDTEYIRVILFKNVFEPIIAIWLKTVDNTPIDIAEFTQIANKVCNLNEKVVVIKPTAKDIEWQSSYQYHKQYRQDLVPTYIQICSCSSGIKLVQIEDITYKESQEKTKGMYSTFKRTKAQYARIDGEKQLVQQLTFQEFEKVEKVEEEKKMSVEQEIKSQIISEDWETPEAIKATENCAKIEELLKQNANRWFVVKRTDIDQCQIIDKHTGTIRFQSNSQDTIEAVEMLLKENGGKENE